MQPQHISRDQRFLTLTAAQQHFGISRSFLYYLRGKGKLTFHRLNRKPYIAVDEMEALITPDVAQSTAPK